MQYIDFKVQHQTITRTDSYEVVGGSQNYLYARFSFCDEWADIIPTAVFSTNSGKHFGVAIENGECLVPWEVLTVAEFWVGVFGGDRITTSTVRVPVKPGAKHNASPGVQPTPPAYEILMRELREGVANIDESEEAAVNAAAQAESAKDAVLEALNNVPAGGSVVVVNDLTTGGTAAALSAEMGKVLNEDKFSKSGGTMELGAKINFKAPNGTGLGIRVVNDGSNITAFDNVEDESANRIVLRFSPPSLRSQAEALRLAEVKDGKTTWSTILHTGNKPSGSYTGNASARSVSIGGVGNVLCVTSANGTFLVTPAGGVVFNHISGECSANNKSQINFTNGVLTIAETATMCNTNGTTYTYQVL